MTNRAIPMVVILGATASGKTGLAVAAARTLHGEIISADSRQVYRGMDLGTGKDLSEYGDIPYHLIDIADPGSEYNVYRFQRDCFAVLEGIDSRKRTPILCGGTGLYLDALLKGYRLIEVPINPGLRHELDPLDDEELRQRLLALKPEQHNQTDLLQRSRLIRAIEIADGEQSLAQQPPPAPPLAPTIFGLRWPRPVLRERIRLRLMQRFEQGMIEEVETLHQSGVSWASLEFYGLEYRLIAQHLQGELSRNDMVQKLYTAICQFAKRQDTWFRRMERQGTAIHWLDGDKQPLQILLKRLQQTGSTHQ